MSADIAVFHSYSPFNACRESTPSRIPPQIEPTDCKIAASRASSVMERAVNNTSPDSSYSSGNSNYPLEESEIPEEKAEPTLTHYVNANCVIVSYFSGDTNSVVDEHFARALSCRDSKHSWKGSSSMNQRNFPASFWSMGNQQSSCAAHSSLPASTHHPPYSDFSLSDPYTSTLHIHHPQTTDAWHYPYHHTSHHQMNAYAPYTIPHHNNHFHKARYGSLLLQANGRKLSGQCDVSGKSRDMWSTSNYHHDTFRDGYGHAAFTDTVAVTDPSKDMYWY